MVDRGANLQTRSDYVGAHPQEPCPDGNHASARPARASVRFALPAGTLAPVHVPVGTRLTGRPLGSEADVTYYVERAVWVTPLSISRIERINESGRVDLTESYRRGPYVYALGGELDTAIQPDSRFMLGFALAFPPVEITLTVRQYEADLPALPSGPEPVVASTRTVWEYRAAGGAWRALTVIEDSSRGLEASGIVRFLGPSDAVAVTESGRSLFWLRLRVLEGGYEIPARLVELSLNETAASEGYTVAPTIIGGGTGLPACSLNFGIAPVQPESVVVAVEEAPGVWTDWQAVRDLNASGPTDRHYVLDAQLGRVTFGDGLRGRVLPSGVANVRAAYRVGGGSVGNLAAGEITAVLEPALNTLKVTNPLPASGGIAAETLDAAWARARADLLTPTRAVTVEDYESIVRATPGLRVARAYALLDETRDCEVRVVVVPYSFTTCPIPSPGFLLTACRHLDRYRLVGTRMRIVPPRYAAVAVEVSLTVAPRYQLSEVERRVRERLREYLDPLRGGVDGAGWPFGRAVYRSELIHIAEQEAGVACVTQMRLSLAGSAADARVVGGDVVLAPGVLVCPGIIRVTASEPTALCEVKPCRNNVAT